MTEKGLGCLWFASSDASSQFCVAGHCLFLAVYCVQTGCFTPVISALISAQIPDIYSDSCTDSYTCFYIDSFSDFSTESCTHSYIDSCTASYIDSCSDFSTDSSAIPAKISALLRAIIHILIPCTVSCSDSDNDSCTDFCTYIWSISDLLGWAGLFLDECHLLANVCSFRSGRGDA